MAPTSQRNAAHGNDHPDWRVTFEPLIKSAVPPGALAFVALSPPRPGAADRGRRRAATIRRTLTLELGMLLAVLVLAVTLSEPAPAG